MEPHAGRSVLSRQRVWAFARSALLLAVVFGILHLYTTRHAVRGSAPAIDALALDGRHVQVPSPETRPRLVRFFATWCGVCKAEEHNLRALAETHAVILIASQSGTQDAVGTYAREHGLTMPVLVDDGTLKRAYGVAAYPTSFFLDARGEIDFVTVGYTTELGMRARLLGTR